MDSCSNFMSSILPFDQNDNQDNSLFSQNQNENNLINERINNDRIEEIKKSKKCNLIYNKIKITDIDIPQNLEDLKNEFIQRFDLGKILNKCEHMDIIFVQLDSTETETNREIISSEENYKNILRIIEKNKDENITYIFEYVLDFHHYIKLQIYKEMNTAKENILSFINNKYNKSGNNTKIRKEECAKCKKKIIGNLYKKVQIEEKEKDEDCNFCEECEKNIDFPLFKIY